MSTADDELQDEVRRLRDEVDRLKRERKRAHIDRIASGEDEQEEAGVDRRKFLKGLAGGAAGLGALGLLSNAAGYELTSSHPFTVKNASGNETLDVSTTGTLTTNQIGTSSNPIGSISANRLNNIEYASSPDEIQTKLDNLPDHGGVVRLVPGKYGDGFSNPDGDWTQTITVPTKTNSAQYVLDLRGSRIDIDSFGGPYIQKNAVSGVNPFPVNIYGPDEFNVLDVTNPGDVMDLWDIQNGHIHWPNTTGPVDSIIRKNAQEGSGHFNIIHVSGWGMQKGIVIGDQTGSVSSDRCIWFCQLGGIEDIGIDVQTGHDHHFWVQPENDKTGYNATGYKIRDVENTIHNIHGKTSTPFDIAAARTRIVANGRRPVMTKSKFGVRPKDIRMPGYAPEYFTGRTDITATHTTAGTVTVNNYAHLKLDAGTTDGSTAYLETPGRIGNLTHGGQLFTRTAVMESGNRIDRIGAVEDTNNMVVLEADAANANWHAKVIDGGSTKANVDTGVGIDTKFHTFIVDIKDGLQNFYIDWNEVASTTATLNTITTPKWRLSVTVSGSPASARTQNTTEFSYGRWAQNP